MYHICDYKLLKHVYIRMNLFFLKMLLAIMRKQRRLQI